MSKIIGDDGTVMGETFSGQKNIRIYPQPKSGETYSDYHNRVNEAALNGFHKGDLSWSHWQIYCMGSGQYDGFDSSTIIK